MKINLSFPPSVNGMFVTDWRTKRRCRSKKYKAWADFNIWVAHAEGEKVGGRVKVLYEFGRPDKRRRDVANYEKAVSDLLVSAGIIEDDSLIEEMTLRWADVEGVEITITQLEGK